MANLRPRLLSQKALNSLARFDDTVEIVKFLAPEDLSQLLSSKAEAMDAK